MKSIKWKIFSGFLVITFMLLLAGSMSIYQFVKLTDTISNLMNYNDEELGATSSMLESVETEDAGVLLLLSGETRSGNETIAGADSLFRSSLATTEHIKGGENTIMVRACYDEYRSLIVSHSPDTLRSDDMIWYSGVIFPAFTKVKSAIQSLMTTDHERMHGQISRLRNNSGKVVVPGSIAILAALVFSILFTYFINKFFIRPLSVLTRKVEHFTWSDSSFDENVIGYGELNDLEKAIDELINRNKIKK
jgi:hypothetical protein